MTEHEQHQPPQQHEQGAPLLVLRSWDEMYEQLVELFLRRQYDDGEGAAVDLWSLVDLPTNHSSTSTSTTGAAARVVDPSSAVLQELQQWVQQQRRCQSSLLPDQRERLDALGFFQWDDDQESPTSNNPFRSVPLVPLLAGGATTTTTAVERMEAEEDNDAAHPPLQTKKRPRGRTAAAAAAGEAESMASVPFSLLGEPALETQDDKKTAATADDGAAQERIQTKKRRISNSSNDGKSNKKSRLDTWQQKFALLQEFQREHGHCRVSPRWITDCSVKLGEWVKSQRKLYRKCTTLAGNPTDANTNVSSINAERIAQLKSIGFFEWNNDKYRIDTWQQNFELLQAFQREHGHCRVPQKLVTDSSVKLGLWVKAQRKLYCGTVADKTVGSKDASSIHTERIARLHSIGFFEQSTNAKANKLTDDEGWQRKFELLRAFQRENGHCRVPSGLVVDSITLGRWVYNQRLFYNNLRTGKNGDKCITEERIAQLNSIGFEWSSDAGKKSADDRAWQQKFDLLHSFQREHGHCRVPPRLVINSEKLGRWVKLQRKLYRNCTNGKTGTAASISDEHIAQLNSIGFEWRIDGTVKASTHNQGWQQKFELLCEYQREHGHCLVPQSLVIDSVKLGRWVNHQRLFYRNRTEGKKGDKCITEERIAKLNSIGFEWRTKEGNYTDVDGWQYRFDLLRAFQREHGHCRVPQSLVVNSVKLGRWVNSQRQVYKNRMDGKTSAGALVTNERFAKLNSVGFEWRASEIATDEERWQQKFELLCTYQRDHGHCRVPQSFMVDSVKLGQWVQTQRQFFKNRKQGKTGKNASITDDRITKLNAIGFAWTIVEKN